MAPLFIGSRVAHLNTLGRDSVTLALCEYVSRPRVHHAVLLDGAWGAGKTYLVKNFLETFCTNKIPGRSVLNRSKLPNENDYVYVSLFGLTKLNEIDEAIFLAQAPFLDTRLARAGGEVIRGIAKFCRVNFDNVKLRDYARFGPVKCYVFDDLERSKLPLTDILGYINQLVEHRGEKVIIVANTEEIEDQTGLKKFKEKVVGKQLWLVPSAETAIKHFIESCNSPTAKSVLAKHFDVLMGAYNESKTSNLRVMRNAIEDFEVFCSRVEERHRENEQAFAKVIKLFFALTIEYKVGAVTKADLQDRVAAMVSSLVNREQITLAGIAKQDQKYSNLSLADLILSDEILLEMLVFSIFDRNKICAWLDQTSEYAEPNSLPVWKALWSPQELTEQEFDTELFKLEMAFKERSVTTPGDILHIFGLRILLSKIGGLNKSNEELLSEGRDYLDDLYRAGKFRYDPSNPPADMRYGSYAGYGIHENDSDIFKQLDTKLVSVLDQAKRDSYQKFGVEVQALMENDVDTFSTLLGTSSNGKRGLYANLPILQTVVIESFVQKLVALQPKAQEIVFNTLASRYSSGELHGTLAEEKAWLTSLSAAIDVVAEQAPPASKHRLMKYNLWHLKSKIPGKDEN